MNLLSEAHTYIFHITEALTFIGCADALAAALSNSKAHATIVAQIVPPIESSDKGVKVIDRGEGKSAEQNGTGIVEGGIDLLTILSDPLCSSLYDKICNGVKRK